MIRPLALAVSMSLLMATGCALNPFAGDPMKQAREMTPVGGVFNQALYRAYLTRAEEKLEMGDRNSARYFADRAKNAGNGKAVVPEDLVMDRVGGAEFNDLDGARGTLVRHLVEGGREQAPEESAQSQSYFDCWLKSAEAQLASEVARCKTGFDGAISQLQIALNSGPMPTDMAGPASAAERRDYRIYFGFDEWHLTAEALSTITTAIDTARSEGQAEIISAGHADRAGPAPYNMKLSERRAVVVKEVMVEMGARGEAIQIEAYGEDRPAVETADGVAENRNRRVELSLLP